MNTLSTNQIYTPSTETFIRFLQYTENKYTKNSEQKEIKCEEDINKMSFAKNNYGILFKIFSIIIGLIIFKFVYNFIITIIKTIYYLFYGSIEIRIDNILKGEEELKDKFKAFNEKRLAYNEKINNISTFSVLKIWSRIKNNIKGVCNINEYQDEYLALINAYNDLLQILKNQQNVQEAINLVTMIYISTLYKLY